METWFYGFSYGCSKTCLLPWSAALTVDACGCLSICVSATPMCSAGQGHPSDQRFLCSLACALFTPHSQQRATAFRHAVPWGCQRAPQLHGVDAVCVWVPQGGQRGASGVLEERPWLRQPAESPGEPQRRRATCADYKKHPQGILHLKTEQRWPECQ